MATYKTPGVKVQEVSTFPPSVAQVETAVPAFIGYTATDPGSPIKIQSMVEYVENFGGAATAMTIVYDQDTATSGAATTFTTAGASISNNMYYSMLLYFANGGGPCYVCSAGTYATVTSAAINAAIDKIKLEDEPTLLVIPEAAVTNAQQGSIVTHALAQCNELQDRFCIFDVTDSGDMDRDLDTDSASNPTQVAFRTLTGTQYLKYGAAYYPFLNTTQSVPEDMVVISHILNGSSTTSTYDGMTLAGIKEDAKIEGSGGDNARTFLSTYGDLAQSFVDNAVIQLPPSPAIAGVYCAVDRDRGVWKAPANVSVAGVSGPSFKMTDAEQKDVNDPTNGKAVNAIRSFAGKGTMVWGARTLDANSSEWRYVPVRRLYITVEESVKKASRFAVFEPNDATLWTKMKGMIENYLNTLWRQGALAGAKPEDAYFVNVGLGSTMTAQDVLNGILNIEIGMAAVRPAEFIVLKFSHKLQES